MFVKYDNNEIISLFVGCIPSEIDEYIEIPDDENIIEEYFEKRKTFVNQTDAPTQLDIIEAQVAYTAMMTNTLLGE